jgi:hypothetical protein
MPQNNRFLTTFEALNIVEFNIVSRHCLKLFLDDYKVLFKGYNFILENL